MKKLLIVAHLILISYALHAQDSTKTVYCELTPYGPGIFGKRINVVVDYGDTSYKKNNYILNEKSGERMQFNSAIDALNYMAKKGWRLVNVYVDDTRTRELSEKHYILKKSEVLVNSTDR